MNQQRQSQRGYHWVINALLTCPNHKIEILRANWELIDAGFVQTIMEVAMQREQWSDKNSATWLRNLATQLATGMGSSLSKIPKESEADRLLWQGEQQRKVSQFKAAFQSYQQSLALYREIENLLGESAALISLGITCDFLGQYQKAINYYQQSLDIVRNLGGSVGKAVEGTCLGNLGKTYSSLGKYHEAVDCQKQSLEIAQEFENHHAAATALGNLGHNFFSLGRYDKAIDYHQQQLNLVTKIIPPLRQEQNTSLSDLVTQARESLGVEEKLRDATLGANQEIPLPIRHISEPLRQLHQYLIEPIANLLPTDPNAPLIFIPQGALFLVPFPALQDATGKFLIEQHTILTVPSIQVLELTRQQRQRIETIHNSSLQSQDVLVVGNPTMPTIPLTEPPQTLHPLPGAEAEANAIASLLNTQAIIGNKATKVDIVQQMPKARLIHLATHGLLDDIKQLGVPGAIALAPSDKDNGFLTAGEILEMKLNAELIVLSACSSGQGKITGDGVIGLSRSLFAAGVPSVIVCLWSVGDKSTQFLMTEFYHNLQHGMNKAQALRQAMLTTMQRYRRPKSWAAFTLIGEAI